ncbi:MAG: hypothetical protein IPO92_19325 [Saprospiraceae bacterium]|nr:hypothetical protein [Saprospiraceae bacterium]
MCTEKNDAYLLYRYGTKQKIELQYPNSLDSSSWQKFNFDFYFRGRGKSNAGMEENYLSFVNKGIQYTIFHNYTAKDDNMLLGISIVLPIKTQEIKGKLKSRSGMMSTLQNKVATSDD